jgi:hypothetical protein
MTVMPNSPLRRTVLATVAALVLLAAGCSGGPQFAEVEGVVTLDGQPLPEVAIEFMPDPEKGNTAHHSIAYTDAQGHFTMHCERPVTAGVAVGIHRIVIRDITALPPIPGHGPAPASGPAGKAADVAAAAIGGGGAPAPKADKPKVSRVPAIYNEPTTTPLRDIEVKPGPQTLNFDVKSGKRRA